jgi:hypothetical protein
MAMITIGVECFFFVFLLFSLLIILAYPVDDLDHTLLVNVVAAVRNNMIDTLFVQRKKKESYTGFYLYIQALLSQPVIDISCWTM